VDLREVKVWPDGYDYSWLFAIASIAASLIVCICAGLESTFGFGDIWREKRNAAEIIKSEGFCFIQLCGPYREFKSHQDAFALFSENVEQLIRSEMKDYVLAVSPQPTSPVVRNPKAELSSSSVREVCAVRPFVTLTKCAVVHRARSDAAELRTILQSPAAVPAAWFGPQHIPPAHEPRVSSAIRGVPSPHRPARSPPRGKPHPR